MEFPANQKKNMMLEEKTLGKICAEAREGLRISVEKAAEVLRIPSRILILFESGEYEKLPPDVFLRGMILKYADFLKLDRDECLLLYEREKNLTVAPARSGYQDLLPQNRFAPKSFWWAFSFKELGVAAVIAAFLYIFWQFGGFLMPPKIILESPAADTLVTQSAVITVSGFVRGTNRLVINGEHISSGKDGRFSLVMPLKKGENIIAITALKPRLKSATVIRKVLYQPQDEHIN
jgi:hypothetical protein